MLRKEVKIGIFNSEKDSTYFTLPKGITVRDVSEQGLSAIDQFENHRFEIVITTDDGKLVDYNAKKQEIAPFGNYYSADNLGKL